MLTRRMVILLALSLAHPAVISAAAGIGVAACAAQGAAYNPRHLAVAGAVGLAAAELAMGPLFLVVALRTAQAEASQAALLATVVHLLVAGAGLVELSPAKGAAGFANWLFVFYAVTLITVCVAAAVVVRPAPVARSTPATPAA